MDDRAALGLLDVALLPAPPPVGQVDAGEGDSSVREGLDEGEEGDGGGCLVSWSVLASLNATDVTHSAPLWVPGGSVPAATTLLRCERIEPPSSGSCGPGRDARQAAADLNSLLSR
jgi:hypothetical protein